MEGQRLDAKGWDYEEIAAAPRRLRAATATTPPVFVDGQYVGGADELEAFLTSR